MNSYYNGFQRFLQLLRKYEYFPQRFPRLLNGEAFILVWPFNPVSKLSSVSPTPPHPSPFSNVVFDHWTRNRKNIFERVRSARQHWTNGGWGKRYLVFLRGGSGFASVIFVFVSLNESPAAMLLQVW